MLVRLAAPALDVLSAEESEKVLAEASISRKSLSSLDAKVDRRRIFQLWEAAAAKDPLFALKLGIQALPKYGEIVGYMARNSPTLGTAWERIARFKPLVDEGAVLHIDRTGHPEKKGGEVRLRRELVAGESPCPISYSEFAMASLLGTARVWTGKADLMPIAVRFPYPAPPHAEEYARIFGKSVTFGEPFAEIVFDREVCELPLTAVDTSLGDYLEAKAEAVIEAEHDWTFEDRVRETITYELTTGPTLDRVAKRLGMSGRTLQRRLSEERLHFSALVEQVRRSKAIEGVENPKLFVSEVAAAIGYHDVQSFREAFVRWTGESPRAYRRARREAANGNGIGIAPPPSSSSARVMSAVIADDAVESLASPLTKQI